MSLRTEQTDELVRETSAETSSGTKTSLLAQDSLISSKVPEQIEEFVAPAIGMEFESYDDAYNYYICYASKAGFSVRVKNSWFKRNSREKYGAVLCCSSQGFKRVRDANRMRKETRTGCPAMMRMRLLESSRRWRILEVNLGHNHALEPKSYYKSVKKKIGNGIKKNSSSDPDPELQPMKIYRTLVMDANGEMTSNYNGSEEDGSLSGQHSCLNFKKGDSQAMYNFFCRMQLTNHNFFYSMDLNDEGRLRNVFWVDAKSRAANYYFCDVIFVDTVCLSNKFEIPLISFVGINHHGQSVLLGCGLLSGETLESYVWILKSWLTTTFGCSPKTVITDRCKILQNAVSEVLPKSQHIFDLWHIIKKIPEKLGGHRNYDEVKKVFLKAVYDTLKPYDFEATWGYMIQHFGLAQNEWLGSLYEDRAKWANVYLKDTTFFMGMTSARTGDRLNSFFEKYVHKQTSVKEFLDKYELALHKKHMEEMIEDEKSGNSDPILKTKCPYEIQMSKVYTQEIFKRFQVEVAEMFSCSGMTQIHAHGSIAVFLIKEGVMLEGTNRKEIRDYEVFYNRDANEVQCICGCFGFYGYLCRHALCVLNFNGVEEIPLRYVLAQWKKDYKRLCIPENGTRDNTGRVQRFNGLFASALQVVEEGSVSVNHYKSALQVFEESLGRICDIQEERNNG